jgi:hypothetical protein
MADTTIAPSRALTRWQASGIHLSISAAIAAVALFLTLKVWYPPPLFTAEGGSDLLFILVAVDVIIGPLITLVIFKSGKPGLRFDLTVIALLQAGALIYGCHVMFVARPVYIALVDTQFETVRANDLDPANLAQAPSAFRSVPVTGPVFVAVELPKDMKVLNELISRATQGGDFVQHLPQYYVPYADYKAEALSKSRPLELLREDDKNMANRIDKEIADTGRKISELNFLPLQTRRGWGAVLVDGKTGDIVKILPPFIL